MKRLLKPLAFVFCLGIIVSCSKKVEKITPDHTISNPVTDYDVSLDSADAFTINYKNKSSNYVRFEWRFGDDTLDTKNVNPSHTFLTTSEGLTGGKYTTDLKNFSSTGDFSHKYADIVLLPDNVLQVSVAKTGVPNQLKFTPIIKGHIASAKWTFNEVTPAKTTTTIYTDISPLITQTPVDFNNFTLTVTTDRGSTVTISKFVTTEGIATDITATHIKATYNLDNASNPNENAPKLVDNNNGTKFGYYAAFPYPLLYALQFPAPVTVKLYGIENGNDTQTGRDPIEWYMEGSNNLNGDEGTYEVIDHVTLAKGFADMAADLGLPGGDGGPRFYKYWYYPIANPKPYIWYRWRVVKTTGAFQIEELRFFKF